MLSSSAMTLRKSILAALTLSAASIIGAIAEPIPDSVKIGGVAIGCQAYSFHKFSAIEAVQKTAETGAKVIEFFPGQRFSPEDKSQFGHMANDEQINTIKELLKKHGIRAVNYGVVGIPNNEEGARKIFEFAKKMGLYAVTTESVGSVDLIEKLAKEYDIRVGFHNHPRQPKNPNYRVWDAKFILDLVKDRDQRLGAAADVGHWATDGFKAVDNLRLLQGRIVSVHMKDRSEIGKYVHDVPFGVGVVGIADIIDELKRQNFVGNLSIEYEYNWEKSVPEIAQCIGFVRGYGAKK